MAIISENDIWVIGQVNFGNFDTRNVGHWSGQIFHYNGRDWYYISGLAELRFTDPIKLYNMDMKGDVVVFVGTQLTTGYAVIIKGVRY